MTSINNTSNGLAFGADRVKFTLPDKNYHPKILLPNQNELAAESVYPPSHVETDDSVTADNKKGILRAIRKSAKDHQRKSEETMTLSPDDMLSLIAHIDELVDERRKSEKQMMTLVEGLRRANDELRSYAHIVSHDLKAPLRAIGSLTEWIYEDNYDRINDEGKENLVLLQRRVDRMYNLIDGILQYSKLGVEKQTKAAINLSDFLPTEVLGLLDVPDNAQIEIANDMPVILAEPILIIQLFQNLISNSLKFCQKRKVEVKVSWSENDEFYVFSVRDNGCGIDKRHQDRIFRIFETLNSRDKMEGSGIGLAVVKKIVQINGGEIWLDSTPNKGTTFSFTFPKAEIKS